MEKLLIEYKQKRQAEEKHSDGDKYHAYDQIIRCLENEWNIQRVRVCVARALSFSVSPICREVYNEFLNMTKETN